MSDASNLPAAACHVLVAEDDVALRSVVALALRAAGFEVSEARGEQDLIDHLADPAAFDVLVLDTWMARIGGTEICRLIRGADVETVFITAEHADDIRRSGVLLPSERVLQKPFYLADLEAAVGDAYVRQACAGWLPSPRVAGG